VSTSKLLVLTYILSRTRLNTPTQSTSAHIQPHTPHTHSHPLTHTQKKKQVAAEHTPTTATHKAQEEEEEAQEEEEEACRARLGQELLLLPLLLWLR
jgi:hypothetical protein